MALIFIGAPGALVTDVGTVQPNASRSAASLKAGRRSFAGCIARSTHAVAPLLSLSRALLGRKQPPSFRQFSPSATRSAIGLSVPS